ncbi:MAG TPA: RNA polymerase sigma factor [Candidatus Atribacteria bacterium]|nr:RNA polymerase sigma factor [Candidatus Atribacteria bacterium]HPU08093.1 RNA polymerase sigma factor [Candidatus Atribacteria bacterium]HPZ81142.1 RNA polymerase sigma factor [Candidatus Atribacteria bacterium]HQE24809.1 RNA polymerase sigma factor [Candidatus Atribacteria bacterium]
MDKAEAQVWYQGLTLEEEKLWFEGKVKSCENGLLRFAYHLSGNMDKARDLVQEAFLRAYQYRRSYNNNYSFESWISTILLNVYRQRLKKEKFFKIFHPVKEREDGEETEVWDFLESSEEGPEERTLKREVLNFLQKAIEELPSQMREVIILCDVMNYSYEEASEIIGCPLGTVRSRLHRARKKVRELVEESYGEDFLSAWE